MIFESRDQAAHLLAGRLRSYAAQHPLVLGIPRGAVPMARILARELGGEFDVVLVHKLRAPHRPELAIGAVDEAGHAELEPHAHALGVNDRYLEAERALQLGTLRARRAAYTPGRAAIDPRGRIVIVVDDGVATGATMAAALRAVRALEPAKLIAAAAVASPEAVERLARVADQVCCLETPEDFEAVSTWFEDFPQISDEEVVEMLGGGRSDS